MTFEIERLALDGVSVIRGRRFTDKRGYFAETWSVRGFEALGITTQFVQDNHSLSISKGTLRGLHFQRSPFSQAKLIRVLRGSIYDVAVDIRPGSSTFGHWISKVLKADDEQLFIPRGFAHGFLSLEPMTEVAYRVDMPYNPTAEGGIRWDDPDLSIDWPVDQSEILLSPRDAAFSSLKAAAFDEL